jgi:arsenate reductase
MAQCEMRHLAQGAGDDPRRGDRADHRRLREHTAQRCGDQIRARGAKPRDLLRRRGTPYDELGLDDETLGDAALIAAMHAHPILIERPVVRGPKGTRLCRPPERLKDIL